jgi:hypothetical protein
VIDPDCYVSERPDDDKRRYVALLRSGVYVSPTSLVSGTKAALWSANCPTDEMILHPHILGKSWVLGSFLEVCGMLSIQIEKIHLLPNSKDSDMEVFVKYKMFGITNVIGVSEAVLNRTKHGVVASVSTLDGGYKRCLRRPSPHGAVTTAFRNHAAAKVVDSLSGHLSNITRKRNAKQWWNRMLDVSRLNPDAVYAGIGLRMDDQCVVVFLIVSKEHVCIIRGGKTEVMQIETNQDLPMVAPQYFKQIATRLNNLDYAKVLDDLLQTVIHASTCALFD